MSDLSISKRNGLLPSRNPVPRKEMLNDLGLAEIDQIALWQEAWAGSFGKRFCRSSFSGKWAEESGN